MPFTVISRIGHYDSEDGLREITHDKGHEVVELIRNDANKPITHFLNFIKILFVVTKCKVSAADAGEILKQRGLEQYSPSSAKKAAKMSSRNCPECRISLPDESAFTKHLKVRHPDVAADYKYKCRICRQFFKTPSARATHMRKHKKVRL